jgi:predicted transcriptional regulator
MDTLSLKIPKAVRERLYTYAKRTGLSRSEVVRKALVEFFEKDEVKKEGTLYDLAGDLAGSVKGPRDLSTNKEHLSGYGR